MSGTGEGTNGAPPAVAVEPSPGGGGQPLSAAEQQQVMQGDNDAASTPVRGGDNTQGYGPNTDSSPPPKLHRGIEAALQKVIDKATLSSVAREFNRQLKLAGGHTNNEALGFYEETCNTMTALRVFASMKPGSPLINVLWGFGKFADEDGEGDVGTDMLAYTGNRDKFGNAPTMVALPRDNSYKWKAIKGHWGEAEFNQHYADDDNRLALRPLPPEATEEKNLPRLLYLPYELGVFAAQRPRTPYELYEEAVRLAGDDMSLITDQHIALVKVWCMGASYKGAENSSVLVLKTTLVSSSTDAFVEFRQKKCEWLLGPWSPPGETTPQTNQQEDMEQRLERMTSNIMSRALEAIPEVASRLNTAQQSGATGGTTSSHQASNPLAGSQQLEGAELYAVMGFCGVTDPAHIPTIWRTYYSSATLFTKRGEIQDQMTEWSVMTGYPINKLIRFDKTWFTDIKAMDLAMGEARATWQLLERGFSAQYCLPVTLEYIARMNAIERADAETEHTRTITERMNLNKTDPRLPPLTLEELQRGVATYAAKTYVHFGKFCHLYKKLLIMRETLESHAVEHARACYTPRIVTEYWFEVLDKSRSFFYSNLRKSDFDKPNGPTFPICSLSSLFPIIIAGHGITNGMFPTKWNSVSPAMPSGNTHGLGGGRPTRNVTFGYDTKVAAGGYGGYATPAKPTAPTSGGWSWETSFPSAPPSAPPDSLIPPTFKDKYGHCHPIVKSEFAEYHKQFGGKLQLQLLVKHSNITLNQLLGQHSFRDASGTNNMCYSYVLGVCNHKACKRIHPTAGQLVPEFVRDLCKQLKPGRDYLIKNPGLGAKRPAKSG